MMLDRNNKRKKIYTECVKKLETLGKILDEKHWDRKRNKYITWVKVRRQKRVFRKSNKKNKRPCIEAKEIKKDHMMYR